MEQSERITQYHGSPATLEIFPLIKSFKDKVYTKLTQIDPEEMSKVVENKDILIKFTLSNISGDYNEKTLKIERLTAGILVRFKESPGN